MPSPPVSSRVDKGGTNTVEGKMRSARNAIKHGLTSSQPVVLEFETPEAWEAFRSSLVESLHPQTPAERCLAEEIALTLWRRRRIPIYEARMTNTRMQLAEINWEQEVRKLPPQATEEQFQQILYCAYTEALLPTEAEGDHLRYEAHLGRQLTRLFKEFHQLQKTRNYETNYPSSPQPQCPQPPQVPIGRGSASELAISSPDSELGCEPRVEAAAPPGLISPCLRDSVVKIPPVAQNCETNSASATTPQPRRFDPQLSAASPDKPLCKTNSPTNSDAGGVQRRGDAGPISLSSPSPSACPRAPGTFGRGNAVVKDPGQSSSEPRVCKTNSTPQHGKSYLQI